jgi:hypothetical protein
VSSPTSENVMGRVLALVAARSASRMLERLRYERVSGRLRLVRRALSCHSSRRRFIPPPGMPLRNARDSPTNFLHDDSAARQQVKGAKREAFPWSEAPRLEEAPYAAVVSLLAERQGNRPPAWTHDVLAGARAGVLDGA